jgi:hypothetical protein
MTEFERALTLYGDAIKVAAASAATEEDQQMYAVHTSGIRLIARRYAETHDPASCRRIIEEERALHERDGLRGDEVMKMRAAFERLVGVVTR